MQYYLSPEDSASMERLSEEVQGKIEEIAQIFARVANVEVDSNTVSKFVHQNMKFDDSIDSPQIVWVEIFDQTPPHPKMCVVYYSDHHGVIEVPCGTPITG
jgi:hypothetical protein